MNAQSDIRLPLAIDLFCGLGGWTESLMAEGYFVIGVDIEQHVYGEHRYPANLVIQDVMTVDGAQFKDADLIVASPPCQKYSYMAMPWSRAKAKANAIRADDTGEKLRDLNKLFEACFRIQREASAAAGRHIPMVVENVRGAEKWVGKAAAKYGSFYLWGDVPDRMPVPAKDARKNPGFRFDGSGKSFQTSCVDGVKQQAGVKGSEGYERDHPNAFGWKKPSTSSKSKSRKFASAMIAKIPETLGRHIARAYKPAVPAAWHKVFW